MTHPMQRLLLVAAAAAAVPTAALAQPASSRPAAEAPGDGLTAPDREALIAAEQLAAETAGALEQWLITQSVSEDQLFARLYFPMAKGEVLKWTTRYDSFADRDVVGLEDKALAKSPSFQYAIVTDINAYVPAHNTRFAQPLTGNALQDYANNRTKRLLGDMPSLLAARGEARYLIQRVRLETGDVIYDVSVPLVVRGKHWGCARIGYRRAE
jgi:methyl-accepting chemotaxis protein